MRLLIICCLVVILFSPARAQRAPASDELLTNASIIKLSKAGFREKTIISIILRRPSRFDVSAENLIVLKKNGLSEKIILAMVARAAGAESVASLESDWDEDSMDTPLKIPDKQPNSGAAAEPHGLNIFGSSGGSRGRLRSRSGNGSAENDTLTTGSATARIIRAPAEAGGAEPKLEKTPTLDNNAVIELVEAGFSAGTVIRRVDLSPAEFDLSSAKLAELRRHGVTEEIIAAMRRAMGDNSTGDNSMGDNSADKTNHQSKVSPKKN